MSEISSATAAAKPPSGAPLLSVQDLTVTFGGLRALKSVSLEVEAGAVVGMIGPNGAGKTTFIDALMGYVPSSGTILFDGQRIDGYAAHRRAVAGLARTFQSLELFEDLTVRENLQVAAERPKWWSVFLDLVIPNRDVQAPHVDKVMDMVGLGNQQDMLPSHLSHGDRQAVSVARALVAEARFVLLDEPGAGLERGEKEGLSELLREVAADGITVFLIDHDMDLVMPTCDHIFVLEFGELIAQGRPNEIRSDPRVIEAYLGRGSGAEDRSPSSSSAGPPPPGDHSTSEQDGRE
jgi:branched-chain amino acid transport system ATP-binding protein